MKKNIITISAIILAGVIGYFLPHNLEPALSGLPTAIDLKGLDNVKIQVLIKENTPQGQFNDALYYNLDQWNKTTAEEIAIKKQERVDNWVYIVTHPAPPYIPTKAEMEEEKLWVISEIERQQFYLEELNTKINVK